MRSDAFGCVRMHLDAFGCVRTRPENFKVFARFFDAFASFARLSDLIGPIRIHSDLLGCIRMHLDAFGCVRTRPENPPHRGAGSMIPALLSVRPEFTVLEKKSAVPLVSAQKLLKKHINCRRQRLHTKFGTTFRFPQCAR